MAFCTGTMWLCVCMSTLCRFALNSQKKTFVCICVSVSAPKIPSRSRKCSAASVVVWCKIEKQCKIIASKQPNGELMMLAYWVYYFFASRSLSISADRLYARTDASTKHTHIDISINLRTYNVCVAYCFQLQNIKIVHSLH